MKKVKPSTEGEDVSDEAYQDGIWDIPGDISKFEKAKHDIEYTCDDS